MLYASNKVKTALGVGGINLEFLAPRRGPATPVPLQGEFSDGTVGKPGL